MSVSKWLILELNDLGIDTDLAELENVLEDMLGDVEYFIPVHKEMMGSYENTSVLFDGYVFVKDSTQARERLVDLRDYVIFSKVLTSNGKLQTIDSRAIGALKRKLKNSLKRKFRSGTKVKVLTGIFKNLNGEVLDLEDDGKKVIVRIQRRSREIIAPIPATSVVEIT